jgi:hypothetical protein
MGGSIWMLGRWNMMRVELWDSRGLGVEVLRFGDDEVLKYSDAVADKILTVLVDGDRPSPQPSPGVPGEGVRGVSGEGVGDWGGGL